MRNDYYTNSKDYINRWVISYADFVTMLLALFMFMSATLMADNEKLTELASKFQQTFNTESAQKITNIEKLLRDNIAQTKSVNISKCEKGILIRVKNNVIFDEGSAEIKTNSTKTLNEIVTVLTKIDNPVIIEGHTDSTPIKNTKYPSNWELSTARATNIISYLVEKGKISPKRLSAVGYGEYMPIENNTTISGRMLNRRVDIIVLEK